jgi:hypothetical protein
LIETDFIVSFDIYHDNFFPKRFFLKNIDEKDDFYWDQTSGLICFLAFTFEDPLLEK